MKGQIALLFLSPPPRGLFVAFAKEEQVGGSRRQVTLSFVLSRTSTNSVSVVQQVKRGLAI